VPKEITFTLEDDDGEEFEYSLPSRYEVCSECNGEGRHVNRSIEPDGGGFTSSEWEEACYDDPDFAEDYFGGVYDVTCTECHGNRVVPVVDEECLSPEQKEIYSRYLEQQEDDAYYAYERAAERRMGY